MKKIILTLFLSAPLFAAAQKLDLSINAGAAITTVPGLSAGQKPGLDGAGELKIMYHTKGKLAYGASIGMGSIHTHAEAPIYGVNNNVIGHRDMTYIAADPFFSANILAGRYSNYGKHQIGAGGKVGLLFAFAEPIVFDPESESYNGDSKIVDLGLFIDYTYQVNKVVGLGLNFNPKVYKLSEAFFVSFPVTFGVHVRI